VRTGWTSSALSSNAQLDVDGARSVSPPRSARAIIPPLEGGSSIAALEYVDTAPAAERHLAFEVYLDLLPSGRALSLAVFRLVRSSESAYYNLDLQLTDHGAFVRETGSLSASQEHELTGALPQQRWIHVEVDAIVAGASPTVAVRVDGNSYLPPTSIAPPSSLDSAEFAIGITFLEQRSAGAELHVDNVLFDVVPLR
jgi:hypothetical protein